VHHPDYVKGVVEKFSASLKSGEPWEDTFMLRSKDGEYRWFLARAVPIRDEHGKVIRWFGTNTDITDLKASQEKLENSNRELDQFAYVASHDLQEPLRQITSFTELLGQSYSAGFDERGKRYMKYVVEGAQRMQRLIQDLLTYSRVGRLERERGRVDCNLVVDNVVAGMGDSIRETNAVVTHDSLPVLEANEANIALIFQNLIGNAIKFRKTEEPPRVHITAKKTVSTWLFAIKDNGIGIKQKYFEKIFVIFQRLHTREQYSGTGIGLSIVKKIVDTYGGKVWVESEPGKGSTFYFTIPQ
jgi:light-regulated signal transduction histidine kinase (bacteriophytochrome)